MKPILSLESLSYEVFQAKFAAWCFEKKIETDANKLSVLPACVDDKLLNPLLHKFQDQRTTLTTALEALKEEYLRQTRPANPESDFHQLKTVVPSSAIVNCEKLTRLSGYLKLNDSAVKQRLFNSLPGSLQQSMTVWMSANPNATSREMANFIITFPDWVDESHEISAATGQSTLVCEHCKKTGHKKETCFKLRTCWNCQKVGHISRNCRNQKN